MSKILIVDDERTILDNLTFILELEDYEVVTASTGTDGLSRLREHPDIQVVITDMRMPGMNGMEVVHAIHHAKPEIGVIVLTGHGDMENAVSAMKEGAFDYLNKPVNADKLLFTLENAIRRHHLLEENRRLQEDILTKNEYLQGLHDSAQRILMNLMPESPPPQYPDIQTASLYWSCDQVGGDMYDCFEWRNCLFFYLFDVCSHGILAAVITMIIKSYFDNLRRLQHYTDIMPALGTLVGTLNREMVQNTPSDVYATLIAGFYDRDKKTLTYVSGGHIDQYLVRDHSIQTLPSTGTMVGLFDFAEFEMKTFPIQSGDKLLLFSDGLTELWEGDQMVEADHLPELIRQHGREPVSQIIEVLHTDILELTGGEPLEDDLTVVGFEFTCKEQIL